MDTEFAPERDTIVVEDEALRGGFTMIPNAILKTPHLTHGAKLCYAVLLSYAWTEDRCFPGQERLAHDLTVERKAVIRYLKELRERGAIRVIRRGLGKTNVYILARLANVPFLVQADVPLETQPNLPPMGQKEYTDEEDLREEDKD